LSICLVTPHSWTCAEQAERGAIGGGLPLIVNHRPEPARKLDTVRMDHLASLPGEHADATHEELAQLLAEWTG
jgi:hypothetical protein